MMHALEIQDLTKKYANGVTALNGISLTVNDGDFFALLGRNGAGKSTTIGILASLVEKTSGSVKIYDADIDKNFSKAKSYLGLVPQEMNFNIFETCRQIVSNQAGYYGIAKSEAKERVEHYLQKLGLWEKRDEQSRALSGGMKRRLMIARALVHQPRLLILDEPTAGVDIEIRQSMWEYLNGVNEEGTTIILTTHYLEEAENLCRNVAIIEQGNIVKNTSTAELLAQLQRQTYVFDLSHYLQSIPDSLIGDLIHSRIRDDGALEVELDKSFGINRLFQLFEQENIDIISMRNKSNRLERLFLDVIQQNNTSAA